MAKAPTKTRKKPGPKPGTNKGVKSNPAKPHPTSPGRDERGLFLPSNRVWEARSSYGPNFEFEKPEQLWDACCQYFQWAEENPLYERKAFHAAGVITVTDLPKMRAMTISGLCLYLGITDRTWRRYRKNSVLCPVVEIAEQIIWNQKFSGASADLLNANIIARELGLAEKQELTGEDGGPIKFSNTERAARLASLLHRARDRRDRQDNS